MNNLNYVGNCLKTVNLKITTVYHNTDKSQTITSIQ